MSTSLRRTTFARLGATFITALALLAGGAAAASPANAKECDKSGHPPDAECGDMWWLSGHLGQYGSAQGCDRQGRGLVETGHNGQIPPNTFIRTWKCEPMHGANEGRWSLFIYLART